MSFGTSEVRLELHDGNSIGAYLAVPTNARSLVLFAHGSGSSRHGLRNRFVADILNAAGIATLLLDLLTDEEEDIDRDTAEFRFNIDLLASRVVEATKWIDAKPDLIPLRIGYFGASTGAAAALIAAAQLGERIGAVVSRGGRPDLAGEHLARVAAPTLLIVGGADTAVIDLNRRAAAQLIASENRLVIIPRAGHLFEEAGALGEVARYARTWFLTYLVEPHSPVG
jgi:dienelactone hydrolase